MKINFKVIMISIITLMEINLVTTVTNTSLVDAATNNIYKPIGKNIVKAVKNDNFITEEGAKKIEVAEKGGKYMVYAVKNINGITCLSVQKHNKYWLPASDVEGTVSYKKDNLTYTITNDKNKSNDITTPNNRKITLVHNAYVYDVKGKRVNKNVGEYFIRKGTVLFSYGIRTIKGKKYYNLGNDQYIKTSNVTNVNFESSPRPLATTSLSMSTDFNKPNLTLKRNTYLYNIKGNRIYNYLGYSYIKKNATINFYNKKKINGKLYYMSVMMLMLKALMWIPLAKEKRLHN